MPRYGVLGVGATDIVEANFPEVDVCRLPWADNSFGAVVSDQVLEHVGRDPQDAINESLRVVRPGGLIIHTTCFMTPLHGPDDYWRFTPEGLAHLCRNAAEIIQADGWGNPWMPIVGLLGLTREPVPERRWHPLHALAELHRSSYAFVVWVVARK